MFKELRDLEKKLLQIYETTVILQTKPSTEVKTQFRERVILELKEALAIAESVETTEVL